MNNNIKNNTDRIRNIIPTEDTFYKTVGEIKLPIKIYIPQKPEDENVLILAIHGGAWYAVKEPIEKWDGSWMNFQAQYYFDKGFKSAAISYRDIKLSNDTTVSDLIDDCKDAIKFLRDKVNFSKLIIIGDSAGGHLAVELGLDETIGADTIIGANPVLNLTDEKWTYTAKTQEDLIKYSPLFKIKKTDVDFLIMHGTSDTVVDYKISEEFCAKMKEIGTSCNYIELPYVNHAFILSRYQSSDEQVFNYMKLIDDYLESKK